MNRKGAATILMVFAASVLAVFVISAWQVQFLYSLGRGKALSEILTLTYSAESRLYDIVARFLGGYSGAFSFPINSTEELGDGTKISVVGEENGNLQTLLITTKKQFATSKLEMTRLVETEATSITKPTQIVLSLDCTGSMGSSACSSCATTRMDEQKNAVMSFVDLISSHPAADKIELGISVFAMSGNWLYTTYNSSGVPTGVPIMPGSGLTPDQIKQAVSTNFGHSGESQSLACRSVQTYTSVGTGLAFMHDYFKTVVGEKNKIEVLITDGEPNQRIPYSECDVNIFCPGDGSYCCPSGSKCNMTKALAGDTVGWTCPSGSGSACTPYARDFLRCVLSTTEEPWTPERTAGPLVGVRDPDVDAYMVTVFESPPASVVSIMESYSTGYYNSASAADLSDILADIFQEILTEITTYTIGKVTPTPIQ